MSSDFEATPFSAPWWAKGPHSQTLLARWLRSPEGPALRRERIDTPDGDFVDLDWTDEPRAGAPIALVLHGLEGNAHRRYMRNVYRELLARGVWAVGMNFRGCSGQPNRTLRFYHSGETGDATLVLERIRTRYPGRRVGAMGFSLGGNVLLKLLGDRSDGGRGIVDAAVAMSVPYDLAAGCAELEKGGMATVYAQYFLRSLKRKVRAKAEKLAPVIDVDAVAASSTIRDFDEHVTAPLHGFADAAEYYDRCSSARVLGGISVPTLLLHAKDDPFLPPSAIPSRVAADNPAVRLVLHERGGHVGFVQGKSRKPHFWGDEMSASFLAARLSEASVSR